MAKKKSAFDFESSLVELEKLVDSLEKGDLSLENSLEKFEAGINLARGCQQALNTAEQKVQILMAKDGVEQLEPFQDEPSDGQ